MTHEQLKELHRKLEQLEKRLYIHDQESYKIQRELRSIITNLEDKAEI